MAEEVEVHDVDGRGDEGIDEVSFPIEQYFRIAVGIYASPSGRVLFSGGHGYLECAYPGAA
jgi:hypothetical protein